MLACHVSFFLRTILMMNLTTNLSNSVWAKPTKGTLLEIHYLQNHKGDVNCWMVREQLTTITQRAVTILPCELRCVLIGRCVRKLGSYWLITVPLSLCTLHLAQAVKSRSKYCVTAKARPVTALTQPRFCTITVVLKHVHWMYTQLVTNSFYNFNSEFSID